VSTHDDIAALTCQELVELVTEYFDDALDVAERTRFEEHLAECEYCENYLSQMRATIEATGQLSTETLEPEVASGLMDAFRTWNQERATP
jgi:anti-sigma factor RsiW